MQGKDVYNPNAGYPAIPEESVPCIPQPPYTDQPGFQAPQPGYPQPQPSYPQPQSGYVQPQDAGYPKLPVNAGDPQVPAPAGYPVAPATAVIMVPTVTVQTDVGPESTRTTCRSCNHQISTRIERKPTMKTHLAALLLCLLGCCCCVCVPYCTDSCLDVDHYCPNCGAFIGSYNQLSTLRTRPINLRVSC